MFFIFLISLYIPFVFTFNIITSSGPLRYFEFFIDIWFLFELIINFLTGYHNKGVLIVNRKLIALNYIKTWFTTDLISSFPYSFLYFFDVTNKMIVA